MLPNQPKPRSLLGTPVRPKPYRKNTIPVIISGVDEKFKSWRKLIGELRQYHPCPKISMIKQLQKGDLLAIGDSLQDVPILQNQSEMEASLGKNVMISLPRTFQTSKEKTKSFAVKGVSTDITDNKFKEFFGLNKISYGTAECLKSKKDGRVLPLFRLEINDPSEAQVLICQSLLCQVTGIVYKV